jgi:Fur family iron response transcriptional regulator
MTKHTQNDRLHLLLQDAGLRPTQQRMSLAAFLFQGCHKHLTAEQVHIALRRNRINISLATVYNALHQFTAGGLLRDITIDPARVYFDTNTSAHHHFFDTVTSKVSDIQSKDLRIARLPKLPRGRTLDRVEVVIRLNAAS